MSLEVITNINMNFSNGAGGHTASVTSALDVKGTDGHPALGVVNGAIGEKNLFSDASINNLLGRFICTSKTNSRTPTGTTTTRSYSDITSLALNSYLVLVRGINAPPVDKDSYYGPVPYFSEVSGSPVNPFPSLGIREIDNKRILVAGKIYNYETAANFNGVKISLVYQNGELVDDLCLNKDMVQKSYLEQPDLSQYDLKFGYTLAEYLDMLEAAGIKQSGLENVEDSGKMLFEASGSLGNVTSAIASYFGFYYFINPNNGDLEFIDSRIAAQLPVTDFTQATDENIVSATFTEDKFAPQDVNVYIGQTEKQGEGEKSPAKDDRPRPIYFKRVDLLQAIEAHLGTEVFAALFACFSQDVDSDVFDKYVFLLLLLKKLGLKAFDWVDFGDLYKINMGDQSKIRRKFNADSRGGLDPIFPVPMIHGANDFSLEVTNDTPLGFDNRINFDCEYYQLTHIDVDLFNSTLNPELPSKAGKKGGLFNYIKGIFDFAGGLYVSNGYGKYKAERMNFQNTNNVTVVGPYVGTTLLKDIEELDDVGAFMKNFGTVDWDKVTVEGLFNSTKDQSKSRSVNDYFFIGKRPWSKLFYDKEDNESIDFSRLSDNVEIQDNWGGGCMFIGGPRNINGQDFLDSVISIRNQSKAKYEQSTTGMFGKKSLRLTYIRSKTPVNDYGDGEEEKDNQLVGENDANQKLAELFDRFDLKKYKIDAPETDKFAPLALSSASGSTTEMLALEKNANKNYLNILTTPLKSSQKSVYGLEIPANFNITINSFAIAVTPDGITTTIGESSLKLIPPDREFTIMNGMETIGRPLVNRRLRAAQRNYLGL